MVYLQSKNILHRDLAARNILIEDNIVKVSDFGLSRESPDNYYKISTSKVPVRWTAVEVLEGKAFTSSADVWSYGVTIWEIFSMGKLPFSWLSNKEVTEQVPVGERLSKPEKCPDQVWNLLVKCWNKDPNSRPSFVQIIHELREVKDQISDKVEHSSKFEKNETPVDGKVYLMSPSSSRQLTNDHSAINT